MNRPYIPKQRSSLLLMFLLAGSFSACDVLEDDPSGGKTDVAIEGQNVQILAQGSAYIDLKAMVKTQRPVRLDIASEPRHGSLKELRTGLLQYSPRAGFNKGRDSFLFSVYSEDNALLLQDSVVIIIEDDTTHLPCGYYTRNDSAIVASTEPVDVYVLYNDYLCGDSANIRLELYHNPQHGTATVIGNHIRYRASGTHPQSDVLFYKVFDITDSSNSAYGAVFIIPQQPDTCQFFLEPDFLQFSDSLDTDTVYLKVFDNDMLCGRTPGAYATSIVSPPARGQITYISPGLIQYAFPATHSPGFLDSLVYEACYEERCVTSKVRIKTY